MAVSKRLRYEVLRRDNHTCRYCGASAPDVHLTVDHVLPVALGGTDEATNLVAACADCNSGKSSSNPDQPLVDQVSRDAVRWAEAVKRAANVIAKDRAAAYNYAQEVYDAWCEFEYTPRWNADPEMIPLPDDWADSIEMFRQRGMPYALLADCARISLRRSTVSVNEKWRYFMGVAWRRLEEIQDAAQSMYEAGK